MKNAIIWRFIRGAVATAITGFLVKAQANPDLVWLIPVILAAGKALRDKFPKTLGWLPI